MPKVVRLHRSDAADLLEKLSCQCQDKKVTDLIVMARFDDGNTISHWFGHDSSFKCLGMVHYMADKISGYIDDD
jgi:hypothetical protein